MKAVSENSSPPSPAQRGVAVRAQGVSKTFDGATPTTALQSVDLDIGDREFVSLIGPSGCGKSTLLSLIADLGGAHEGDIEVHGKTPRRARLDRDYGIVFQEAALLDWRRVEDNVRLPLEIMHARDKEGRRKDDRVEDMLRLVGLQDFNRHYPWQLSGGMQQRVAIARALVFQPRLLLMDEPFGALDEITRERMDMELLRIQQETDTSVLFVTHSISEAVFLSTKVAVMSARPGRIADFIEIDLPQPRDEKTRQSQRFFELVNQVRQALETAS